MKVLLVNLLAALNFPTFLKVKKRFFIYETNRPFGHRMGNTKRLTVVQMQRQQCHAAVPPAWCAPLTDATCCQPYIQQAPADDRRGSAPPPTPHAAARCEKNGRANLHRHGRHDKTVLSVSRPLRRCKLDGFPTTQDCRRQKI